MRYLLILLLALSAPCQSKEAERLQQIQDDMQSVFGIPDDTEIITYDDLPEYMEFFQISDVQDEPLWQLSDTPPVYVGLEKFTEFEIPDPDSWQSTFSVAWPLFLEEENGALLIYGMHAARNPLLSMIGHYFNVDGVNRWQLGNDYIDTNFFDFNHDPRSVWYFGANLPDHPGPEYIKFETFFENDDPDTHRVIDRVAYVYGTDGSLLAELTGLQDFSGLLPNFPQEYPDTSLFSYINYYSDTYYILNINNEPERVTLNAQLGDMEVGHLLRWFADSEEWIANYSKGDTGYQQFAIVNSERIVSTFNPNDWAYFPEGNPYDIGYGIESLNPFYFEGHRYCLFSASVTSYDPVTPPDTFWCVQFDPGDTDLTPVWCRHEPYMAHSQEQILLLGDNHPFWVRFSPFCKTLRVIDLVSGYAVYQTNVEIEPIKRSELYITLVNKLSDHWDIPSVLFFDPNSGLLSKYDLAIISDPANP